MDEEFRRRGERLFHEVFRMPAAQRQAFLDAHCPDARVRAEVEDLIEHADRDDDTVASLLSRFAELDDLPNRIRYFGDYELLDKIASGGMGVVYRARQTSLHRVVALKMIRAGQFASTAERERFRVEVETAAGLDHPNIVPIYEVGDHEGRHYFTMKLIEGESLAEHIATAPLAPRVAAEILEAIARAVHHAHQRGILHRDLKPGNVLLDANGEPYVSDFGLAKNVESDSGLTRTGEILGTPSFMAPEQAAGRSATVSGDIYGLGAILYNAITGRPPFGEATPLETLKQVQELDPEPPGRLNPLIDADLETICLKCLEKDPRSRYPTAAELTEEFRRFLSGEPIEARPITPIGRTWRWCRRRPTMASLLFVVVMLVVAITVGSVIAAVKFRSMARNEFRLKNDAVDKAKAAQRATKELERLLYVHQIAEANHLTAAGWYGPADDVLDDASQDLRGWEWWHLKRRRHGHGRVIPASEKERHRDVVHEVEFSPDGVHVASGSRDGSVKLWNVESGALARTFEHQSEVLSLSFSPDGEFLACGTTQPTVKLWNVASGEKVAEFPDRAGYRPGECCIEGIDFNPDGSRLAWCAHDGVVRVWSVTHQREELRLAAHSDKAVDVAFSPDGTQLASAGWDRTVRVWDVVSGRKVRTLRHEHWVQCVEWSPDGQQLAAGDFDMTVRLWDQRSGKLVHTLGLSGPVSDVTFSPDGRRIVAAGLWQPIVYVWDRASGGELLTLPGMMSIDFSPDGHRLAAAGDTFKSAITLWEATPAEEKPATLIHTLSGHDLGVMSVAFSPDGRQVATSGLDSTVRLWDADSGGEVHAWKANLRGPSSVAFSPDGKLLAAGGRPYSLNIWDLESREKLELEKSQPPISLAFAPDGRLAGTTPRGSIRLFDPRTGERLEPTFGTKAEDSRHHGLVLEVAFSPDGKRMASGGIDGSVRVWNVASGSLVHALDDHTRAVWGVEFSPDGTRLVTSGDDGKVMLWDPAAGKLIRVMQNHHDNSFGTAFSPDGKYIAAGCGDAGLGRVVVWNVDTGREVLAITDHTALVMDVTFSPDGRLLATASYDRTAKLWDISKLSE